MATATKPKQAPALAQPEPTKVYGWNVMNTCPSPDVVLEHKSKHDYLTLLVARTEENDWVGGYLCRTAAGAFASPASLKSMRFATSDGAALMTEGAKAGQIVEVVLDAAVASQPDVVAAIKQEKAKQTQKEKDDAAKVRALGAARRQAYHQLSADARGDGLYTAVLLRRMLLSDLQYGRHKAVKEMLQQVYGWGEMSTRTYMDENERKQIAGYLSEMDTPALQSLLLDLQLVTWLYEEHPSNLPALCKELGWPDEELLAAHAERKKGKKQEATT